MFKSVEYAGFDGQPELRRLAELGTELLPGEIQAFRENVHVRWVAHPGPVPTIELDLRLQLPSAQGRDARTFCTSDFSDIEALQSRIRRVWLGATGDYLENRKPAWDALMQEPLEAA